MLPFGELSDGVGWAGIISAVATGLIAVWQAWGKYQLRSEAQRAKGEAKGEEFKREQSEKNTNFVVGLHRKAAEEERKRADAAEKRAADLIERVSKEHAEDQAWLTQFKERDIAQRIEIAMLKEKLAVLQQKVAEGGGGKSQ